MLTISHFTSNIAFAAAGDRLDIGVENAFRRLFPDRLGLTPRRHVCRRSLRQLVGTMTDRCAGSGALQLPSPPIGFLFSMHTTRTSRRGCQCAQGALQYLLDRR